MKVLLLDLETAPNLVHVWGLFQQNVGLPQIIDSGYILCWAAKWYDENEIMFSSIHQATPKKMLKTIHKLVDEADAVVHFNGTKFDMPTLNKEFLLYGLTPPSPYKQIDLLRTCRSKFRFTSNKLDYVAQALGLGKKTKHRGHQLWIDCMAGVEEAWKEMEEYNINDVVLLEKVYDRLKGWISGHPDHGLYGEHDSLCCPNCGSGCLRKRGYAHTALQQYQRYICRDCGKWSRGATRVKSTGEHLIGL